MNTLDELFPSKYLKASDAEHADLILTIKEIKLEEMNSDNGKESKPVVYFQEVEKGLVLNKTNKETIQKLHGGDIAGLTGKKIALFSTEVQSFGETTLALRIRLKAPEAKPAKELTPAQRWANWRKELQVTDDNLMGILGTLKPTEWMAKEAGRTLEQAMEVVETNLF